MKRYLVLFVLLFSTVLLAGDYDYTLSIQNQQVSGTDFTFDVYMLRTGTFDVYLGDSDFCLDFNSGNFTSPAVSVVTADTRLWDWYSLSPAIVSTNRIVLNVGKPTFNDQTQFDARMQVIGTTGNGTRIAQIKITNISTPTGTAGLVWRSGAVANTTTVNRFDNTTPWAQHNIDSFATYTSPSDVSLPVELNAFTAECTRDGVVLNWSTHSEQNNLGYILEKQLQGDKDWETVASYVTHEELKGAGTSTSLHEYQFTDASVNNGENVTYRLSDVDRQGQISVKKDLDVLVTTVVPKSTALHRPYPNPFNPVTTVRYDLSTDADVSIYVYNLVGQQVAELFKGKQEAGEQSITWNAANMPSGMYLVRMQAGNVVQTKKCLLLK